MTVIVTVTCARSQFQPNCEVKCHCLFHDEHMHESIQAHTSVTVTVTDQLRTQLAL
jgi:hypothetical protein